MAVKRKRDAVVARRESHSDEDDKTSAGHDILRQHFEAMFEPLPQATPQLKAGDHAENQSENDSTQDSDWDGLSDDELGVVPVVQVVEHSKHEDSLHSGPKSSDFKAFMTSKPPREVQVVNMANAEPESEDESETLNLKHDLDLQRLLKESHLLESGESIKATGTQRHKATDLRIQHLGSKASLFSQESMPMSHRKGINAKASTKDARRRKDAAENGIILEKAQTQSLNRRPGTSRRERGVDAPLLGKFRGGTLKLSSKDIAGMQDPRPMNRHRARK